jgi:hypothetical protein
MRCPFAAPVPDQDERSGPHSQARAADLAIDPILDISRDLDGHSFPIDLDNPTGVRNY